MRDHSHLFDRPFDIKDGDRYLILLFIRQDPKVLTHIIKGDVISSNDYEDVKTWATLKAAQNSLTKAESLGYNGVILQVKDLLKPMYYVGFDDNDFTIGILAYTVWKSKTVNNSHGYFDSYDDALKQLTRYKQEFIKKAQDDILKLKNIQLTKI